MAGARMSAPGPIHCPHCGANLLGNPIPNSPTGAHYRRDIGVEITGDQIARKMTPNSACANYVPRLVGLLQAERQRRICHWPDQKNTQGETHT